MTTPIDIILQGTDQASGVIGNVGDALGGLGGIAGGVLTAGLATAAAGLTALGAGAAYSVKQAMDAQQVQSSLAQVIKSTGGAAGLTQDAANALANQFRDLAGGTSEAVLGIEEIGLRAGTISADQMPKFIQTTLDLGQVMGSTSDAATLLARAQEDPVAAMNKAQRAGIIFSAALKDQIKQLVKNGDTAGATALLMDRLGEATGGAAAANADTFAGKWELLQGHLSEAAQTVGNALLPILENLFDNVIAPAVPFIESLAAAFAGVFETIQQGGDFGDIIDGLGDFDAIQQLEQALGMTGDQFYALEGVMGQFQGFMQPVLNAFDGLWAAIQLQLPAAQAQLTSLFEWLMTNIGPVATLLRDDLANAITALAQIWAQHGDEIMAATKFAFEIVVATITGAIQLVSGIVTAGLQLLSGNWQGAFDTMQATLLGFFNLAAGIVGTNWDQFSATWKADWEMLQIIIGKVFMDATASIQKWLIDTINTIRGFGDQMKLAGQWLMDNVLLGIQMKVAQIIAAVSGMVTDAIAAAGRALGMASPGGSSGDTSGGGGIAGRKADGGGINQTGNYLVGERGPEVVTLPGGSYVTPNNALGSVTNNYNLTVNNPRVDDWNLQADWALAKAMG